MRKLICLILVIAVVSLCACASDSKNEPVKKECYENLTELYDHVYEVGTYTSLDYDYAENYFKTHNDNWGGGCTAAAKTLDDGTALIGRNMDLTISHKCAYVLRTKVEGCYETVGLTYTFRDVSPTLETVKKSGVGEEYGKLMPFFSDDVLNSEGFYVEVNMRYGEENEDGNSRFASSGTNPGGERVYVFSLPIYLGTRCATVEEALEYVKTLDIYSQDHYWGYCFMMADATGRFGLLEIAKNKIIWHEGQHAQANFYVDEELAAEEELKCGVGRYNKVMEGIDAVKNESDMFSLMDSVSYFQVYDPEKCAFDYRSEYVNQEYGLSYDVLMNEESKKFIERICIDFCKPFTELDRNTLMDMENCWESIFTEAVNCKERTIHARFFEDDTKTLDLKLK